MPGEPATFTVTASGQAPFTYQWQRNGADIAGATASSYTVQAPALTDNGAQFRVVVTNAVGSVTSSVATLSVTNNAAPTGTILTPAAGRIYNAGDTIACSADRRPIPRTERCRRARSMGRHVPSQHAHPSRPGDRRRVDRRWSKRELRRAGHGGNEHRCLLPHHPDRD